METLHDVQARYFELTRASYKRTGSDSSTLETSMAEAEEQIRYELLDQPGGGELWDRWKRRRPKQRTSRSVRRQQARGEQVLAEADALLAELRADRSA